MSTILKKAAALAIGTSLGSILVFAILPIPLACSATQQIWHQYRVEQIRPEAERYRAQAIASSNPAAPNELFGTYSYSSGYESCVLDLGQDGFYYEAHCCTGTTELAYGHIASVDGTKVKLERLNDVVLDEPCDRKGRQRFRFAPELYLVAWDKDRFVVPAELMPEFCFLAKARGFDSMEYADYPYRVAPGESSFRRQRPLEGLPSVPAEFRQYLPQ